MMNKSTKENPYHLSGKGFLSVSTLLCVDIASWAGKPFLSRHIPPDEQNQ